MAGVWSETGRLPLAGLVVIDFGQIFQGPYATFLLAKGGADVIKIEPPHGEPLRRRAAPGKSATLPFARLNQNKRAVTLNLRLGAVKRLDLALLIDQQHDWHGPADLHRAQQCRAAWRRIAIGGQLELPRPVRL